MQGPTAWEVSIYPLPAQGPAISIAMTLNLLIALRFFFFFPIRKYIQATAAFPDSRASHKMCSNDTGKMSKIQASPASIPFFPPTDVAGLVRKPRLCDSHATDGSTH